MSEPAKVRLVLCPKCENLLLELSDYSVYQCNGCGAVLRAKNKKLEAFNFPQKSGVQSIPICHTKRHRTDWVTIGIDSTKRKPVLWADACLLHLGQALQNQDPCCLVVRKRKSGAGSFEWQFLVGGMDDYNDDFGIVPWERPSTYQLITEQSCWLAAIRVYCLPKRSTSRNCALGDDKKLNLQTKIWSSRMQLTLVVLNIDRYEVV